MTENRRDLFDRVLRYQNELISFFAGGEKFDDTVYGKMRDDLLRNPAFEGRAPDFLKKHRDTGSLWSFAKSVDSSWEPRRNYLREQFEPLLDYLENGSPPQSNDAFDASAWTGITTGLQRVRALRNLIPLAQASVEALIMFLEQPNHNGAPPLDEVTEAMKHLKLLHAHLGSLLEIIDSTGNITIEGEGLIAEAARYGKRAARALKSDPIPYALSATILGLLSACGFPGIGGYLGGIAMNIRKSSGQTSALNVK